MLLEGVFQLLQMSSLFITEKRENFCHRCAAAAVGHVTVKFQGVLGHLDGIRKGLAGVGIGAYPVLIAAANR